MSDPNPALYVQDLLWLAAMTTAVMHGLEVAQVEYEFDNESMGAPACSFQVWSGKNYVTLEITSKPRQVYINGRGCTGESLTGVPSDLGLIYEPGFNWGMLGGSEALVAKQPSVQDRADGLLEDRLCNLATTVKDLPIHEVIAKYGSVRQAVRAARESKTGETYQSLLELDATLQPLTLEHFKA